jgi:hypothetical protein
MLSANLAQNAFKEVTVGVAAPFRVLPEFAHVAMTAFESGDLNPLSSRLAGDKEQFSDLSAELNVGFHWVFFDVSSKA